MPDATAGTAADAETGPRPPEHRQPPPEHREPPRSSWPVLAVIGAGGVLGALARHGVTSAFAHLPGGLAVATFGINVTGCLLIGVLMVLVDEVWAGRPLLRPFLGVGVLGGFTTFSAYILDASRAGGSGAALVYLAGTLVAALAAVWTGATVARRMVRRAGGRETRAMEPASRAGGRGTWR